MGPTPITSSIKTATPCGWLFLWLLVEGSRRADQKKPQWGFFPPPGSASQRLRSPQGKQPAACAETPITSSKKKTTLHGWFSFWNLYGRESEGGSEKAPVGLFPPPGSASQRLRSPQGKQPAACAETPITSTRTSFSVPRSLDKLGMTSLRLPSPARDDKKRKDTGAAAWPRLLLSYFTFSNTAVFASTVREPVKSPVAPQRASKVPSGRSTVMGASPGLATR